MKKIFSMLCGLMAIVITACSNEEIPVVIEQTPATPGEMVSVKAYAPGEESRVAYTSGESGMTLSWETNESFSVIRGSENKTFSKTTAGNTFTGVLPTDGSGDYYAFYPANLKATYANKVPFSLVTQTGTLNSGSTYMYAVSTDGTSYQFNHVTAILKTTFTGLVGKIKKVQVLCATPVSNTLNLATGAITPGDARVITIDYATSVDAWSPVYVYLPPMAKDAKTLKFMVTTESGYYEGTLAGTADKAIEAGKLYTASVTMATATPYVTFTAPSEQKLKISKAVDQLQYSVNGGDDWSDLGTSVVTFGSDKNLLLRGKNSLGTNWATISFTNDVKVACTGDIRTLVDWETYTTVDTKDAKFNKLFYNCSQLTLAPALPATTLAEYCYEHMFSGCTSLETAPELPATTLAKYCYENMFNGCFSLKSAPALPATTLAEYCYQYMFLRCISLKSAPALPATTLAEYCYRDMFKGCTSMTSVPDRLPAETLANGCYKSMFEGCTSLETAPALPATTLQPYCYQYMFDGCTKLNSVTMLATDISATDCLNNWLNDVASSGIITRNSSTTLPVGTSGKPSDWKYADES